MAFLTPAEWNMYINTIYEAWETFATEPIVWRRMANNLDIHGEDTPTNVVYTDVPLICLFQYNYFRTWPITQPTPSGEIDKENFVAIFSRKYLTDMGHLTAEGNFNFRPGEDRFFIKSNEYKAAGDTHVAGAFEHPLLVFLILKREEIPTGERVY